MDVDQNGAEASESYSIRQLLSIVTDTDEPLLNTSLLLAASRTPLDKPFPITPLSTSSSPILTDGSSPRRDGLPQDPIDPRPPSPAFHLKIPPTRLTRLTKRNHALLDLIESERDYVSDLALIRDIYLPVALAGHESPTSSTWTLSAVMVSDSSSSISLGPAMTREDVRIIFGNISDLAEFADDFITRLELALGSVLPKGEGEDAVGALFIETVPHMEPRYMLYNTHHPAALAHLSALPQTPALIAYHNTTRALAQQLSPVWDLTSLLIKPVQRLLKYALLLHAIIEETPDSHGDKDNLRRAKAMIEDVLRAINEGQRRREIVKEVFAAGKPAELLKKKGIGIMGRVRGRSIVHDDSEEAVQVTQMERDIIRIDAFVQQFTKETVEWVKSVQALMSALHVWAECFGRIIGLCPDVSAKSFDAFFDIVDKQLLSLCTELEDVIREQLLPKFSILLDTIKRPRLLLDSLHALRPHHLASLQHVSAKGPPSLPALSEASTTYVALRAQLCAELPAYLKLLNNGVTLCVGQVANWQAGLWRDVRARWSEKLLPAGPEMRTHALLNLIESARAYASDLALIRDIYVPIALGHEPPTPTTPQSSSSSTQTISAAPGSSSSTSLGPPMTREDVRIIFGNISDLAEFADDFTTRLELALGSVLPDGEGEDAVGALFMETVPHMEPRYMLYITHHPAALAHLSILPQTPALIAYHSTTRTLAQQLSNSWDLPSLLIRPVQRLLKYAILLRAIIQETPDSHADKENLRRAKIMVEDMSRIITEARRRREIVKEVFAAGKPAELLKKKGLGIVSRVRGGVGRGIDAQDDSEEAVQVAQMERDISRIDAFIQQFTEETVEWVKSVQALMCALRVWAEGFGRVIGLGPDVSSEAFDAFLVVVDKHLSSICTDLEVVVRGQLLPQLDALLETLKRPTLLLETLHALEPHHFASLQQISAKGRPPPAPSTAYVALRAQLCAELPSYLKFLNTGVTLCVGQVARWQARLWRDVRTRWSELWDSLRIEGEMNAGREETERVWQVRWEEATRDLRALSIINPEKISPRSRQVRATTTPPSPTTMRGAVNTTMHSLEPARTAPADTTAFPDSISSTRRKSGRYAEVANAEPVFPLPLPTIPRQQSTPTPLRQSSSQRRLLEGEKGQEKKREEECERSVQQIIFPTLPDPRTAGARRMRPSGLATSPASQWTISSRWYHAPSIYSCRVIHECDPPEGVQYYSLPFFRLSLDDVYHVLKEAGHPCRHRDLPLLVDEGEDCLLLARDSAGELGWLLASFLYPVD